ncbi:MAG: hypothetical protein ACK42A_09610 [Pyrinomonadaceae bacterium]|jgi:hypothetical protein
MFENSPQESLLPDLNVIMGTEKKTLITESEFGRICKGIREDRETIIRHNPLGTDDEILLWMLLGCLTSYLSLSDMETPCFPGKPDANAYRAAISAIVSRRMAEPFDVRPYLDSMIEK